MDRKTFLQRLTAAGIGTGVLGVTPLLGASKEGEKRLTILHTNDTHARLDPFPDGAGRYGGLGGIARRAALVKEIRAEQPHNLLLDAGDVFQGTPYFNQYGGELDFKLMSEMHYDAMAIGNHEFDNGVDGFVKVAEAASFPFICSNYDFGNTAMSDYVRMSMVKVIDGIRVGLFGLGVAFDGLVLPHLHKGIRYQHALRMAQTMSDRMRYYYKCDLVICLSHLGYQYADDRVSDRVIAAQTRGIDLIIGGHTHTFLEKPEVFRNENGGMTVVTQVGFAGMVLGRIDYEFNRRKEIVKAVASNTVLGDARISSLV